ncbi:hypothetical protein [Enhygromyxa salina]|nr:hypothetical protein [Enhygromyxa salina]
MTRSSRLSLAIAIAWAGGFGSLGPLAPPQLAVAGLVLMLVLVLVLALASRFGDPRGHEATRDERAVAAGALALALALLLGLLARTLGRVVIAVPAALWALPVVGAALWIGRAQGRWRVGAVVLLTPLALAAGLAGSRFELDAVQARGAAHSGPIIGVHPRQAVGIRIDGFGPHDIIVDDYVDPPGGLGYDPEAWAARLELELHEIARVRYADGPARAREAFARAEVRVTDAIVPPADLPLYESLLGVEVRSGTSGAGSRVEFVCPGQPLNPRNAAAAAGAGLSRGCPRKYLVDGSTGLGLSPRWPGYTELRGRDRARVGPWLSRTGGGLALESGVWLMLLVAGASLLARYRRAGDRESSDRAEPSIALGAGLLAALVLLALGVATPSPHAAASPGPALLALALALLPWDSRTPGPLGWACAAGIALMAASPLAGHGDAIALIDAICELLVLELGFGFEASRALAGTASVIVLAGGLGICAGALVDLARAPRRPGAPGSLSRASSQNPAVVGPLQVSATQPAAKSSGETARGVAARAPSEGEHTRALLIVGLSLAMALGLALRKPGEDLALLGSAAAVLIVAGVSVRGRGRQLALGLACALGAGLPLLSEQARSPVALGSSVLAMLACVALTLARLRGRGPVELG